MSSLNNAAYLIQTKKELNIAYIGGSVTAGYGSTDWKEKSWPTLVSRWVEKKFGVKVRFVNAGIGGTSSYLANFRFDTEVAPVDPDLLFIEFAVNDFYEATDYRATRRQSESLLSKAYLLNPDMDIVYVFTYDLHYENYDYPQLRAHRDSADRNGLLSIQLSHFIYNRCRKTGENPHDFYIDWVHPNDRGYQIYAEIIEEILEAEIKKCGLVTGMVPHSLATVSDDLLTNAHLVTGESAYDLCGWTYEEKPLCTSPGMKDHGRLIAEKPGSTLKFDFTGSDFGLFYGASTNCGKLKIVVDDREQKIVDTYLWHTNCKECPVFTKLNSGKHTVSITLLEDRNQNSTGTVAEIGAFLVG